jgi:hypothetical protein
VLFVLFVFFLCLVHPLLPVSLDCPLWICPVGFFNVDLLISLVFCVVSCFFSIFVMRLVCPMLPLPLDYPFLILYFNYCVFQYILICKLILKNKKNKWKQFRLNKNVDIKYSAPDVFLEYASLGSLKIERFKSLSLINIYIV